MQEKAYVAGIIDGEGTVTLTRRHKNETPSPNVSIANTNIEMLKWIREKIGCGIIVKRSKRKTNHSTSYVLTLSDYNALTLLADIKNFLIIKKPHAELILKHYKKSTPRNGKYTKKQTEMKKWLVDEIRKLNQR
jgi:hypothetical protein